MGGMKDRCRGALIGLAVDDKPLDRDGYRVDLLRLSQGVIEYYGLALVNSMIASIEQLSEEDKRRAMAAAEALGMLPQR
jgi:hypothetical protein